jgi:hypothetical protein
MDLLSQKSRSALQTALTASEWRFETRNTFAFFAHCAEERDEHFWIIASQTCDRCGITCEAHFDHPQRCPAWMTDERLRNRG